MHIDRCGNIRVCLSVRVFVHTYGRISKSKIQNGLCKTQEPTERWELPVCDSPMALSGMGLILQR